VDSILIFFDELSLLFENKPSECYVMDETYWITSLLVLRDKTE
jgi:hypothetical protein